jgi:hypothetical protein
VASETDLVKEARHGPDRIHLELRRTGTVTWNDFPDFWGLLLAAGLILANGVSWLGHRRGWTLWESVNEGKRTKTRYATLGQARAAMGERAEAFRREGP